MPLSLLAPRQPTPHPHQSKGMERPTAPSAEEAGATVADACSDQRRGPASRVTASDLMAATPSPSPITATAKGVTDSVDSGRAIREAIDVEMMSSPAAPSEADSLDIIVHQSTMPSFSLPSAAASSTGSLCPPSLPDVPDAAQMRRSFSRRSSSTESAAGIAASLLALDRPLRDAGRASATSAHKHTKCRFTVVCFRGAV